jgi:hypothetical protein
MPFKLLPEEAPPEAPKESFGGTTLRGLARTGIRAAEQVAGFPGDILSIANEFVARPLVGSVTGKPTEPYEKLGISKIFPSTEQLREGDIRQTEFLKPQNKVEKFIDDIVTDATSLFIPGKKITGIGKGIGSSLIKSVGANVAKETVKDLTADEKKGAYAHLGALTLLSFIDKNGAAKAISQGYAPLEARAAKLSPVSSTALESNLKNLSQKVSKGSLAPSEKFIVDEVNEVLGKVKNNTIAPEELWALKRSLNEKLSKVLFDIPQKGTQQRARKLATGITKELDNALKLTQKQDPTFYKDLKSWNHAYATFNDSNLISKWIDNNVKYSPATVGLLHLFGGKLAATASTAAVPYQAYKILYRLKSPELAKHYTKALSAAAAQDSVIFNRELKIIDKKLEKQEKSKKYRLLLE